MSISTKYANTVGLKEGMIVSNEPGFYEVGSFGVRIENLLVIKPKPTPHTFNDKLYLSFEQLTHVPIQASLIDSSLLTDAEVAWLDGYHERVWERISPRLDPASEGAAWLRKATRPLAEHCTR